MIDTDKYEGHTPAPWKLDWSDTEAEINKGCEIHIVSANKEVLEKFTMNPSRTDGDAIYDPYITSISCGPSYIKGGEYITEANARLIADAPKLLAEVKRLREGLQEMLNVFETNNTSRETMRNRIETILKGDD